MFTNSDKMNEASQLLNSPSGMLLAETMVGLIAKEVKKQRPDEWEAILSETFLNKMPPNPDPKNPLDMAFSIRGVKHVLRPIKSNDKDDQIKEAIHFTVEGNEKHTVAKFPRETHHNMFRMMAAGFISVYDEQQRLQSIAAQPTDDAPNPKSPWYDRG